MSRLQFSFSQYEVCPDRLRFTHVDGHVTEGTDRATWYEKIAKHEKDNGRELAPDWKEAAQDQLCRILPPGWCTYTDTGQSPTTYANVRFGRDEYTRGMNALIAIATTPDAIVSQQEANERGAICAACPANVPVEGCAPCLGLMNLVAAVKGARSTEADPLLKACAACGCSNKAQIWLKAEVLRSGVEEPQKQALLAVGNFCWKAKALWPTEVAS